MQRMLYGRLAVWAIGCFILLAFSASEGSAFGAWLAIWIASPIPVYFFRYAEEEGRPKPFVGLRHASWAFLFGDLLFLPFATATLALGWHQIENTGQWFTTWWWLLLTIALGYIAGVVFHHLDGAVYTKLGAAKALSSPSKLAHDFVAYPVLFGGLVYLGIPVLIESESRSYGYVALIGIILWLLAGIRDMRANLDPFKFHPLWDRTSYRPLS